MPNFDPNTLPPSVREAFKMGALAWPLMVQRAITAGIKDLDKLASIVFYMHHPERNGQPIAAHEQKLITEWKAFRSMIAPLIDYKPKPEGPKPPAPSGPKPNPELQFVLTALDEYKFDGKLTERQRHWAAALATDVLGTTEEAVGWVTFASDLADLVVELPLGIGAVTGCLGIVGPFLQFISFMIIIGDTYDTDLKVYGAVGMAYSITGWAFNEIRTSSLTMRDRLMKPTFGSPRTSDVLDDYWRKTRYETEAKMLGVCRKVGSMTAEKNVKLVLQAAGKKKLARAVMLGIADGMPNGKWATANAIRLAAQELSYPN